VVVTDGDARAAALVGSLLDGGARVTVAAVAVVPTLEDLAVRGLIRWRARPVTPTDVADADLVVRDAAALAPDPAAVEPGPLDEVGIADAGATGTVTLVGAGPGDPGLMTLAGRTALEAADTVLTDRLVPLAALAWTRPGTEIIDVAKVPGGRATAQRQINRLLIERARAGRRVVRLKGGDGFVLGRGGEEVLACAEAGVPVTVVPGVSSSTSVPALAGIPVTHRGLAQGFSVVSGHLPPGHPECTVDFAALAASGTTIVVLMGVQNLPAIATALCEAGMDPTCPAAVIADGALPSQLLVRATLATVAERAAAARISPPAITVIGAVAGLVTEPRGRAAP
jgi:uroporphyrin-III C-methyltransferase